MIDIRIPPHNTKQIGDLLEGETFLKNQILYLKTLETNHYGHPMCVQLNNGEVDFLSNFLEVHACDLVISVNFRGDDRD